jgi:hypothetical protein
MSTVLKAVQQLDGRGAPLTAADLQAVEGRRRASVSLAAAALLVVLTGVLVARRMGHEEPPPTVVRVPVAAPEAVAPPPAPVARVMLAPSDVSPPIGASAAMVAVRRAEVAAPPWGRIESPDGAPGPEVAPAARRAVPASEPKRVAARPAPARELEARRARPGLDARHAPPDVDAREAAPAMAARSAPREIDAPARPTSSGVPPIDVVAIIFSEEASARKAVLRIDGHSPVTLRQGESSHGIDLQIITERSVYMRHNGNIFSVPLGH